MKSRSQSGFTLIELMITTAISAVLLLAVSSVFMVTLLGNARASIKQQISDEGKYALEQMKFILRNSVALSDSQDCLADQPTFSIVNQDSSEVQFSLATQALHIQRKEASDENFPNTGTSTALTSTAVVASNLQFSCEVLPATGQKNITVSFILAKTQDSVNLSETFSSIVQLRN